MTPAAGWIALLAGLVSFFSPCMWPMYPAYLTYLAGSPPAAGATWTVRERRRLLVRSALFLLGFGLVFIALGATASAVGQVLSAYQVAFRKVSGLLVMGFGLSMAGLLPSWLLGGEHRLAYQPVNPSGLGAIALGAAFAFGWTPCVGPVLAAILLLSSVAANLGAGVELLALYTLGFALPFFLLAVFLARAGALMRRLSPYLPWIARGAGLLLVGLGVLIYTNEMSVIAWALYSRFSPRH